MRFTAILMGLAVGTGVQFAVATGASAEGVVQKPLVPPTETTTRQSVPDGTVVAPQGSRKPVVLPVQNKSRCGSQVIS